MKRLSVILILILIVALFISFVTDRFKVRYKSEIDYYADEYSIDRHLVYALIKAESSFDPDAVSHKGGDGGDGSLVRRKDRRCHAGGENERAGC